VVGASHQTVRIARGRHKSPDSGACVMELSSMLAGERFSDRPACVDRVVGAYMRALNDRLGARDRQRLYPYAALAVGTRDDGDLHRRRRDICLRFLGYPPGRPGAQRARLRLAAGVGVLFAFALHEPAAELAARRVIVSRDVDAAFGLLDDLLAAGRGPSESAPLAGAVAGLPELRVPSRVG
jgi:hypothetical protein